MAQTHPNTEAEAPKQGAASAAQAAPTQAARTGPKPSRLARALRGTVALTLTLGALGVAGAGVFALTTVLADRAAAVEGPAPEPPVGVKTRPLTRVAGYEVTRRFVGTVEPLRATDVAFELPGVVADILVDEGDEVAEGQLLARVDTSLLEADRDQLLASIDALGARLELARRTLARQEALNLRGHASDQRLDEAALSEVELMALITETRAAVAGVTVRIAKSEIRAPFAGRIAERFQDDGAIANAGQPMLRLLEDARPRVRVGVAPSLADTLAPGDRVAFAIAGRQIAAEVARLTPDLDSLTRTRTVLLTLDVDPVAAVGLYGRTGTLALAEDVAARGAWMPIDAMREGARGTWTVLTLGDVAEGVGTVTREAVEVLHTDGDRVFVRGTFPEGVSVIESGPHRVVPGQRAVDLTHPGADALLLAAVEGA